VLLRRPCRNRRRNSIRTFESLPKPRRRDQDEVAEAVRRAVRAAIAQRWNKKPICHVHVLTV
jgi:ribonuclease J